MLSNWHATNNLCSSQVIASINRGFHSKPVGTYGNVGRNAFADRIFRRSRPRSTFRSGALRLQVRAEAFNILNHTTVGGCAGRAAGSAYGTTTPTSSATFGQVTGAYDPRILRFAMKSASGVLSLKLID